ncbi:hypothetical protein [Brevirhabdus pacifica]|jgi:hypothetical protein|uniref:hypothetical protein n=1 Tax=Brevirhabdus pacifica TaxID=1267768 RepID=UPI001475AA62|nr:hypothetical protein [Brevirhabdus pacifica]MDF3408623.1 hypothetical protein [Sulfitobacter sp. Ks39]|tara:strand:+ start:10121 stop:10285 length:165 start_codon:yes stop_codon:yes gene_type:complete
MLRFVIEYDHFLTVKSLGLAKPPFALHSFGSLGLASSAGQNRRWNKATKPSSQA